jgi:hypothetical protein
MGLDVKTAPFGFIVSWLGIRAIFFFNLLLFAGRNMAPKAKANPKAPEGNLKAPEGNLKAPDGSLKAPEGNLKGKEKEKEKEKAKEMEPCVFRVDWSRNSSASPGTYIWFYR